MIKNIPFRRIMACLLLLIFACIVLYFLPPVHQRLSWRVANLRTQLFYYFNPPDQVVLSPNGEDQSEPSSTGMELVNPTLPSAASQANNSVLPTYTHTVPSEPAATLNPPASPTPIPFTVILAGVPHEYQSFNNCGPANLSMLLRYWGWSGDQRTTQAVLRPNQDDANVMPEEMAAYVEDNTDLKTILRVGGSLELIKQLIAAGFPLILETGHHPSKDWWMGHYILVNGYDDSRSVLITQDSLIMPDLPLPYEEIEASWWRDFNNVYLIVYPPVRESEVAAILGAQVNPQENRAAALETAISDAERLTGRDQFFALYNQAELLFLAGQIERSVTIFDDAFTLYQTLDDAQRPWRILWYRDSAYQAYYQAGRYQSVIDLSSSTLSMLSKRGLEESHFWRGMAYEALGDTDKAIFDYEIAIKLRPTYQEARMGLDRLSK